MARSRNIKPGFFTNDELAECSPLARLLFAGLWTIADKEGRLDDRPKKVKALVLPFDNVDCDELLQQLHDRKFIQRYQVQDGAYIQITNWKKHQNPHCKEAPSEIPEYCEADEKQEEEQVKEDESTMQVQCNNSANESQVTDKYQAQLEHSASTVQEPVENNLNPADSFNLIPDSLILIPDSVVNTQAADATCSEDGNVHQMASRYAFEGNVIRLNQKDFDSWKALFKNIDLAAELTRLDLEFTHEKPKNWFSTASAKLNYQNKHSPGRPIQRAAVNQSHWNDKDEWEENFL
ncbi:hypothetical protein AB8W31_22395 [Cronobacter sakazakii]|uniref:hypothetical protein n=2 Tax=Cronobacter sakazakii TaxID=28141 RepID=UPI00048F04A0|nr:hypothetical protein [Cronobacter sakazakii]EGT4282236.1 hypothetical protein [Cronobacter malonaticus]EGT4299294.1 hypothetical protein [Cronobacter malonaticus]EGT4313483.1 hypothetical protein [Cronobacter malonaticus]EJC8212642.1 hypothetical protein [Cronobacter sakazakii]EKC7176274.1 hypothetical protein [Cronobacter sakazakii]